MDMKSTIAEMLIKELEKLNERIPILMERKKIIEGWLKEEEPQATLPGMKRDPPPTVEQSSFAVLAEAASKIMSDGIARSNADIAVEFRNRGLIPKEGKYDKRRVNSIMLSLLNRGDLKRKDDKWHKK